jgi:adenine-specific DNA-methyltransferase
MALTARMHKKPPLRLQTTTLWYYPSQQYSEAPMGTPAYPGATPAWVIWNVLERYTRPGDLVVDPFCGGGTTLDVARSLERRALGYDVEPQRDDVFRADARSLPLEDAKADFVFMDPPYSTHIEYSGRAECIGELDAFEPGYFEAMEQVFAEADRVLRDRRYLAVYCCDTFRKKRGFVGIGATFFSQLAHRFRPVDHVAVVRGNRKLENPNFHRAAAEENFFLRGFNHLLIFKKERAGAPAHSDREARAEAPGGGPAGLEDAQNARPARAPRRGRKGGRRDP